MANVRDTVAKLGGTKLRTSAWLSEIAIADESDGIGFIPGAAYKVIVASEDLTSKSGVKYSRGEYMIFPVR